VAFEDGSAFGVELALPDDSHPGSFKSNVKAANTCE
jgi:hypothetical protein